MKYSIKKGNFFDPEVFGKVKKTEKKQKSKESVRLKMRKQEEGMKLDYIEVIKVLIQI